MKLGILPGAALFLTVMLDTPPEVVSAPAFDSNLSHTVSPLPPEYSIDADRTVSLRVCFNWSCSTREQVTFSPKDISAVARLMALCTTDTLYDRIQQVRIGIWQMERLAQEQIPALGNDREINLYDKDLEGRTDCIDNASNTTTFLNVLQAYSLLPGWAVSAPGVRHTLDLERVHWTAVLVDEESGLQWSVDSWFRPHGHLPFVMALSDWAADKKGWEPPLDALNPYPRFVSELCPPR